jgi:CRP/FNR family transcriptional regulator
MGANNRPCNTLEDALQYSFLRTLPREAVERLLSDALSLDIPSGSIVYHESDAPRAALVTRGLLRVYMVAPDGRQVTVRYARTGDVLGIAAVLGGPPPVSVQALVDSALLMLNVRSLHALGTADVHIAWAVAEEVTRRLYESLYALARNTFGSVRQRVARHLLDLATATRSPGERFIAPVSHQELADAVGSVREVIARTLRQLRAEGMVETSPHGITILDPVRLAGETWQEV